MVTLEEMVEAVRDADRPLTRGDIAERVGVTRQALDARQDELEADPRLTYDQIGNARAYWIAEEQRVNTGDGGGGVEPDDQDADTDAVDEADVVVKTAPSVLENRRLVLSLVMGWLLGFVAMSGAALGLWAAALFLGVAVVSAPVAYYAIAPAIIRHLGNDEQAASVEVTDDAS